MMKTTALAATDLPPAPMIAGAIPLVVAPEETFSVQGTGVALMEIVERSDDMNGIVGLPSPAGRAHALLVRAKSPPRQGLREPCRDP
jgi:hypothetical protein